MRTLVCTKVRTPDKKPFRAVLPCRAAYERHKKQQGGERNLPKSFLDGVRRVRTLVGAPLFFHLEKKRFCGSCKKVCFGGESEKKFHFSHFFFTSSYFST